MSGPRVLVVGAGPAGLSAVLWLRHLAVPWAWWEATDQVGGTLRRVGNPITTQPGSAPRTGMAWAEAMAAQQQVEGLALQTGRQVTGLEAGPEGTWLAHSGAQDGSAAVTLVVEAVLLATGTCPRWLGLPGEAALRGNGVEVSVTRRRHAWAGAPAAVVGGGDAALEGALLLAEVCPEVHLVHRRSGFGGQPRFVEAVQRHPGITLHRGRHVTALEPAPSGSGLSGVALDDGQRLAVRSLYVRVGVEAVLPPRRDAQGVAQAWPVDAGGYLPVDAGGRTGVPGVWAAGDVTGARFQSLSLAQGQGAAAAWDMADALGCLRSARG
jgi:thioredoxin reductase (NADPH)